MASAENKQNPVENRELTNNDTMEANSSEKLDDIPPECASASSSLVAPDEAFKSVLQFAKANHLKYKRNNTYCKLCDVKISSSLKRLKEHVAEQKHKDKAASVNNVVFQKVQLSDFMSSKIKIESLVSIDIVINEKFYISFASYETVCSHGIRLRCHVCEVSFKQDEIFSHIDSWQHKRSKQTAYVLVDFNTEFIREVRPGVYHCGFCNFIEGSMNDLKNHLKSVSHGAKKVNARNKLIAKEPEFDRLHERDFIRYLLTRGFSNLFL